MYIYNVFNYCFIIAYTGIIYYKLHRDVLTYYIYDIIRNARERLLCGYNNYYTSM